jgi:hypothetical protein
MYSGFAIWIQRGEDTPVFAQDIVDIAHKIVGIPILSVVVVTTAVGTAKLGICPAGKFISALYTGFFHKKKRNRHYCCKIRKKRSPTKSIGLDGY